MSSEQASQSNTSWGYETGFTDTYRVLGQVGKGGNGVVNRVVHKASGREYACKVLPKHLADTRASDQKRAAHPESVRNEVIHLNPLLCHPSRICIYACEIVIGGRSNADGRKNVCACTGGGHVATAWHIECGLPGGSL